MRDPTQTPLVQACAHAALVLVCLAVTLDAPVYLMGFVDSAQLPYVACFIAAVWLSGFLIPSPGRLSLTVVIATLVWTSLLQLLILANGNDVKEASVVLTPFGSGPGLPIYLLLAFIAAGMLLLIPLLLRRDYPAPNLLRLARSLLISLSGMLAVVATLSFIEPISRFLDPLKILLAPYLFPLLASAVAVLLWSFLRENVLPKGTPNA